MIVHIFGNTNEVFSEPIMEFINKHFNSKDHQYFELGEDIRKNKKERSNLFFVDSVWKRAFVKNLENADKIILHSISEPRLLLLFLIKPAIVKKVYWIIWGGDLYFCINRKKSFKYTMYELIRKHLFKRFGGICTLVQNDYKLAKDWYKVKGKHYKAIYINETLNEWVEELKCVEEVHKDINILLGNSATESNNHLQAIIWLSKFKENNIKVYCPLSYGDMIYREQLVLEAKKYLGNKFIPIYDKMEHYNYTKFLNSMDIGIFNNDRQQGLGNIYTLLELGKKVYVRDDITTWEELNDIVGVKLYPTNEIADYEFSEFVNYSKETKERNVKLMELYNGVDYAKSLWGEIFSK